ncbi:transposase [Micromonospora nigra]|uniref:transposase n=1 Tax=Micromonospora nigra TaxID=145857 RepID=UPI000ADF1592|nr:transposase [Micromonospora nigra]
MTALLRTVDLNVDARRALTTTTITTHRGLAHPRRGSGPCRLPSRAIRLARRIRALDAELAANHTALHEAVTMQAPQLLDLTGVGAAVAATVLLAWSHPGHIRSDAAFAALAGASPLPASSGNTTRHRLNRGRRPPPQPSPLHRRPGPHGPRPRTRAYVTRRTVKGRTKREVMRNLKRYISR